ncbi:MAG: UDP-glucose 4-epimerase GalE [Phycisphaerales bacterium]
MRILVTGGAGFIGSHAALRLVESGHEVVVVDNLSRGRLGAIAAIDAMAPRGRFSFVRADVGDRALVGALLREHRIEAVMHFAALAYVGESVQEPLRYYGANTAATIGLLGAMVDAEVTRLVFSSTCATYGEPDASSIPIAETTPQRPVNPYGRSKLFVEQILQDHVAACAAAGRPFACAALRYFNVAGADARSRLGEDHRPETHLIPLCLEVALGRRPALTIFGTDYATSDGTCVRDYVHVEDLIDAHRMALAALDDGVASASLRCWNVGLGRGHSVREVVESCRRATGRAIPTTSAPRRAGDPPILYADAGRIRGELGWMAKITDLDEIVASAWRWRKANPDGYAET